MPRSVSDAIKNAVAGRYIRTANLFMATFHNSTTGLDEIYYLTDNFRDVVYGGNTYLAVGHLLGYEGIDESSDFQIATARITLSGVDLNLISAVLQYLYIDRSVEIWRCFFTIPDSVLSVWDDTMTWDDYAALASSDALLDSPVKIFSGMMSAPTITEDPTNGTCQVQLTASSLFSDFERKPGRHTNNQEQQAYSPGDRFFEGFGNPNQDLVWGHA